MQAFELWCWRTLRSPLECKEIKLVNPKEISPEYSLEGLMLKLKLQYFGHLMQKPWCWERLKAEGDDRRWDVLDDITNSMELEFEQALGDGEGQRSLLCCSPWDCKESDTTKQLNWTELTCEPHGFVERVKKRWQSQQKVFLTSYYLQQ